jgi:hypothetical protein
MNRVIRVLLALLVLAMALPPEPAWARGRGFHHHRHRTVFVGAFFLGPAWYAYHPPPYYYGPAFAASDAPPSVYVEKFEGAPSAELGEIFCPQLGQHYPDVQECPGGWQRVIRATETAAQGRQD